MVTAVPAGGPAATVTELAGIAVRRTETKWIHACPRLK
jgi:hypothetical protein